MSDWSDWDDDEIELWLDVVPDGVLDSLDWLFEIGWLDPSADEEERATARELFLEYLEDMGFDRGDFDWDAWRDWYAVA